MADIYYYARSGVAIAIIALTITQETDDFDQIAFLNDHGTWSGIHGHVSIEYDTDGNIFQLTGHFHCLGWRHLRQRPETSIRMFPGDQPGRVHGIDHRHRRVSMTLIVRRMRFQSESELRQFMEDVRDTLFR